MSTPIAPSWAEDSVRPSRRHKTTPAVDKPPRAAFRADWLPLLVVLLVQGALSYRLSAMNTAFLDEGTYLYSGYQELAHLLHGHPVSAYETFFSGAPVIYPVVVALADLAGGLQGARILSLLFMLSATVAVHLATRRIRGSVAAFFAAALFAALGPTQFLGMYATYDAMALACLAWAGYFAVRLATGGGYLNLIPAALAMSLADCTKYASLLWTPVVLGIAVFAGRSGSPWQWTRWKRGLCLLGAWSVALAVPAALAGSSYISGFNHTTLKRNPGHDAPSYVAEAAAKWVGPLLIVALLGVVVTWFATRAREDNGRSEFWLTLVLLLGGLLAPVNQVRIHTWLSLQKHVDFGAWFACIVAGILLARIFAALRRRVHLVAGVLVTASVVVPMGYVGAGQAKDMFTAWPDSASFVARLEPYIHKGSDQYLVEDYDVPAYYLRDSSSWQQWHDLVAISYTDSKTGRHLFGAPAIKAAIADHAYKIVVLDFAETPQIDKEVQPSLKKSGYRVLTTVVSEKSGTPGHYTIYLAPGFGN
ncbi:4-amino-4-deoxy-L-arabinose transferase-like glycosyltransferase [Streptacidiphilus sp. MAP12-16]|uniref:ArnT family glycosyltransferase n=1 Tax=Streptacidiphilus sp. MAP12-16 TaxID=3156300 RepID=UPI0035161AE1